VNRVVGLGSCALLIAARVFASINVVAQTGQGAAAESLPPAAGANIARAQCLGCHGSELIVQQRLSREGWVREVDKMIGWGARVDDGDKKVLVDYLAAHFADRPAAPRTDDLASAGARVMETRCATCHGVDLISQQRLSIDGWSREVDKMIGWGTSLNPEEKTALVEYLSIIYGPVR
jgi:mono/diheme cytochrome c family protein